MSKLYATVQSERASKGQGGNDELVINLKVGNKSRREIANIILQVTRNSDGTEIYSLTYYPINRRSPTQALLDAGEIEPKP